MRDLNTRGWRRDGAEGERRRSDQRTRPPTFFFILLHPLLQSLARGAAASRIGCIFSARAMDPPIFSLRMRKAWAVCVWVGGDGESGVSGE
jgi:hypothetical protein